MGEHREGSELLQSDILIVTCGPFEGRICLSDDSELLSRTNFSDWELSLYEKSGVGFNVSEWEECGVKYVSDVPETRCEIVTFGYYLQSGRPYYIPQQALRPVNMHDLISRYQEISNQIAKHAYGASEALSKDEIFDFMLEKELISEEIWEREVSAMNNTQDPKTLFLCHSSADKPFVRRVYNDLIANDHKPWMDEFEIKVGDSIVDKINNAHEQADAILLFISENSANSNWVKKEWQSALMRQLSNNGISVLPVRLDDCTIPPLLADIKYADFRIQYHEPLQEILSALQ